MIPVPSKRLTVALEQEVEVAEELAIVGAEEPPVLGIGDVRTHFQRIEMIRQVAYRQR